jgi:hypothetical protein
VANDVRGCTAQKIAGVIQEDATEGRDEERGEFEDHAAPLAGPGAGAEGDGTSPELALRLVEERQIAAAHHYALAEGGGFIARWLRGIEPDGDVGCALANMEDGAMTRDGIGADDDRLFAAGLAKPPEDRQQAGFEASGALRGRALCQFTV